MVGSFLDELFGEGWAEVGNKVQGTNIVKFHDSLYQGSLDDANNQKEVLKALGVTTFISCLGTSTGGHKGRDQWAMLKPDKKKFKYVRVDVDDSATASATQEID